jgi:acyl-CoA synthetase (NDP forming)
VIRLDTPSLDPMFRPRSIAVIGASNDANKIGGRPLRFLRKGGYAGNIFPVNPNASEIQGLRCYRTLGDVDKAIDQAIIALPAKQVLGAVDECIAVGVKAVQIFSAGFAEANNEGKGLQEQVRHRAMAAGVRVLGPNNLGLFNVADGFFGTFATALDATWPETGSVAVATQSGAVGSYCLAMAQLRGLRFSHFVATGNEMDVDVADCIAWLARDPSTKVVMAAFEGCRDGRRLMAALGAARDHKKPVVLFKVGTTEAGAVAAASHTGSLAGSDEIYDAVFRSYQVHRAYSLTEMIDVAYACSSGPPPRGNSVGMVTTSGGVGVLMADVASEQGLHAPQLSAAARRDINQLLPMATGVNPVDTTTQLMIDHGLFARVLDVMLADQDIDIAIGFLAHVGRNPSHFGELRTPLYELRARHPHVTFALCMMADPPLRRELEERGFLVFDDPSYCVAALAAAARMRRHHKSTSFDVPVSGKRVAFSRLQLNETESKQVIAEAGIPVALDKVVSSARDARLAAEALGFPVAMKIVSPDIAHKSDVGGVVLGLESGDEAVAAFHRLMAEVPPRAPGARIDGVLATKMIDSGVETVLGATLDPVFGPVVMFGMGGVFLEVLKDVAFRPAPIGEEEAMEMVRETKAYEVLQGARGRPPADLPALARALARLSQFAAANVDVVESVDVNPFIVLKQGAIAVDALVVPTKRSI